MKTECLSSFQTFSSLDIDLNLEGFSLTQYRYVNGEKKSTEQSYLLKGVGPTSLADVKSGDYKIVGAVECISDDACRCVFTEGDPPNLNLQIPIFPFCVGTEQLSEF